MRLILIAVVLMLVLTACGVTRQPSGIKPAPPMVTDCLQVPTSHIDEPPPPPATLTDEWVAAAWGWMSDALGWITADREAWAGERGCVRAKAATGAVR